MSEFRDINQDVRLQALERRVTAIMERLGMPDSEPAVAAGVSARVAGLARSGRSMEAVQAYVRETGADLRSARDAVAAIS
jgi:hypothetical protein